MIRILIVLIGALGLASSVSAATVPIAPGGSALCAGTAPTPVPTAVKLAPGDNGLCTTPVPTSTATPTLTATATATATPTSLRGQPCPSWVHDQYVTTGPDGKMYPTWHPPVDPQYGCFFGHEHGADPRTSLANNTMPAFGYIGSQIGDNEPHTGFKVFVINHGTVTDKGETVIADYRVVFHMGTSGVGRYTTRYHSMQYDYVAQDGSGRAAHVMGMADMGPNERDGSACAPTPARNFSTLGCADTYEIWSAGTFQIMDPNDLYNDVMSSRVTMTFSPAVFDPITTRNPVDNTTLVFTQNVKCAGVAGCVPGLDPLSPDAFYQGCRREMYGGPNFWNNVEKPTVYYTDVYGHVQPGPGVGFIRQEISSSFSRSGEQFKVRQDFCGNGIHSPN